MAKVTYFLLLAVLISVSVFVLAPATAPSTAAGPIVGYYELTNQEGQAFQVPPIVAAGGTPVLLTNVSAAELGGINVLLADNRSNDEFGAEWVANVAAIDAAIQAGMTLVVHDFYVTSAASDIPGAGGITFTRTFTNHDIIDINIASIVSNGPAGILDDTSLDGGNSSSHGFATIATLPPGSTCYLIRDGFPDHCVAFSYPYGSGVVYYSSIPLAFYLEGSGTNPPRDNFTTVYAPNVIAGAINGSFGGGSSVVGPAGPPNNGEVTISTSRPVIAYETPGGNPVRPTGGSELFLPQDWDGNGFDTHLLNRAYTFNGELWLQIFIGGNSYVFVRASDVDITRGQLPSEPAEWTN